MDEWKREPRFINHDPLFILNQNNYLHNNTEIFTVVRNPFTRAFSYYIHFKKVNKIELRFIDFLILVKLKGSAVFFSQLNIRTPMIFFEQSFYISNILKCSGFPTLNKIYKFEEISELENDLDIVLPRHNVGNYNYNDYYRSYGKKEIELVKDIYKDDFYNFEYSLKFI